jgi:hypothetical protein
MVPANLRNLSGEPLMPVFSIMLARRFSSRRTQSICCHASTLVEWENARDRTSARGSLLADKKDVTEITVHRMNAVAFHLARRT